MSESSSSEVQKKKKIICHDLENKLMVTRGEGLGEGIEGVWDRHVYTAVLKMDNQHEPV